MTQMTPNEFYALIPIVPINDAGDSLLRTLIKFLAEQQVWQIHIPEVNKVRSLGLNWVTMDELPEINVKTYVDYSQETFGDWRKYIYSLWYMNSPCALVHAGGKYSDDLHIVVTDSQDFKRLVEYYLEHAIIAGVDSTNLDDYICDPETPIQSNLFTKEYLERYYDIKPNISLHVNDEVNIMFEHANKQHMGTVTVINIRPHRKHIRYYGKLKEPIKYEYLKTLGFRTHLYFGEEDIIRD